MLLPEGETVLNLAVLPRLLSHVWSYHRDLKGFGYVHSKAVILKLKQRRHYFSGI